MNLYQQSIPVYRQGLAMLSGLLTKAEAHAKGDALLEARLADDMHPLSTQIRFISNLPGEALPRLSNRTFTSRDDDETNLAKAKATLAETDALLDTVSESELIPGDQTIILDLPNGMEFTLTAEEYIRDYSLPNFNFHLVTAYAILRSEGLEIGKADFLAHMFKYATKMPGS